MENFKNSLPTEIGTAMIETWIFLITIIFMIGITLAEARQDFWVVMFQDQHLKKTWPDKKDRWKFWGNVQELGWIIFYVISVCFFTGFWTPLFWIPILWMIRTIFHNGFIALMLDEKFSYLGDTGFDGRVKKMCLGSGAVFLAVELFILLILILTYLSIKFNLDLWQMILNIFR